MRAQTATKLAVAAIIVLLFAGFLFRAAMRLASVAMHSILGFVVVGVLVGLLFWPRKSR